MEQPYTAEFWRDVVEMALFAMREPMTLADAQAARFGMTTHIVAWKKARARARAESLFSRFTPDSDESRAREDAVGEAYEPDVHELSPLERQRDSAGMSFSEGDEA